MGEERGESLAYFKRVGHGAFGWRDTTWRLPGVVILGWWIWRYGLDMQAFHVEVKEL